MKNNEIKIIDIAICGENYIDKHYDEKVIKYFPICDKTTPRGSLVTDAERNAAIADMLK